MHTIALVNQKGGVGKSTTAVSLSAGLARLGKRVLLVDLDPQAHATVALGLEPRKLEKTVYTLLSGRARAADVVRPVSEGLSIIPSNLHLAGGEAELASLPNPCFVLKEALAWLDESQYDFAIVDSPPQLGFLNINSLAWVRHVFIPVTCEFYALHGLSLLMETVERVRAKLNPDLRISGVITCQIHPRRAVTREVLADLERHFPGRVLGTRIRINVRLVEAPSHGKSIFDYAPDSHGAADYMSLSRELLERISNEPVADPVPAPAFERPPESETAPPAPATIEPTPSAEAPAASEAAAEPQPAVVAPEATAEAAEAPSEPPTAQPVAAILEPTEAQPPDPGFVKMEPGVPPTTPVAAPFSLRSTASLAATPFGEKLASAGLKPIVTARPGAAAPPPPSPKPKGLFGRFSKMLGGKERPAPAPSGE